MWAHGFSQGSQDCQHVLDRTAAVCACTAHTALVVMSHGWTAIWIGFSSSRLYCAFARPLSLPRCNTGTEGIHGWPWRVSIYTETSLCCSCAVCPFALCNADGCGCSPSASRTVNGIDRWRLPVSQQKRGCPFHSNKVARFTTPSARARPTNAHRDGLFCDC